MLTERDNMFKEIKNIKDFLHVKKKAINNGIMTLMSVENKKMRDTRRKEILLKELKMILCHLESDESKIISDYKSDAFDLILTMGRLEEEAESILALAEAPQNDGTSWKLEVDALMKKIHDECIDEFVQSLKISVGGLQSGVLSSSMFEKASDAIFIQTDTYSPQMFNLIVPEKSPNYDRSYSEFYPTYFEVQVHSRKEDLGFSPLLLKRFGFSLSCPNQHSKVPQVVEECTVWSKVESGKAKLSADGKCVRIWIKRPQNLTYVVAVKLFNSNIGQSPLVHQFLDEVAPDQVTHNLSLANGNETGGIEMFDKDASLMTPSTLPPLTRSHSQLDQSDYNSLDITNRYAKM